MTVTQDIATEYTPNPPAPRIEARAPALTSANPLPEAFTNNVFAEPLVRNALSRRLAKSDFKLLNAF